jgi:hypothetical protein
VALYLISYDIRSKNHDYRSLADRLKQHGAVKILHSEWFLTATTAEAAYTIAEDLNNYIFPGDSLLVQEVGKDVAWAALEITKEEMERLLRFARC